MLDDGMICTRWIRQIVRMICTSEIITYCEIVSIILEAKLRAGEDIPLAVDTLGLVLANDDVTESSAVLKNEDGVLLTALNLVVACAVTTVVLGTYQRCFLGESH